MSAFRLSSSVVLILIFAFSTMSSPAATREAQWKEVEAHLNGALPQSALGILTTIESAARAEENWPELAKAVAYRVVAETRIEGDQPEVKIRGYEKALAAAPPQIAPLLKALLASAYRDYFEQNRWRFLERTRTTGAAGENFETWDLPRLFAEIDAKYRAALENPEVLQHLPVSAYDTLLIKGNVPDPFRPTLYDFLAHEALAFYTAAEQAGSAPEDAFAFDATSPALGSSEEFLAWKPASTDPASPTRRAVTLYQDLMRFHAGEADPSARVLIDLDRIEWAASEAGGDRAEARALVQLNALLKEHEDVEAGLAVASALAARLMTAGDFVEARRVAIAAADRFPDSIFAGASRQLVHQVESRELQIGTEQVWNAAGPEIEITYRNLTATHFRLVPRAWTLSGERWETPEQVNREAILAALQEDPVAAWTAALETTADYRQRTIKLAAPAVQKTGFYLLIASASADFATEDNQLSATTLWVSPLALITREAPEGAEGFVLDALSGEPIGGATVEVWAVDKNGRWKRGSNQKTDALGFFEAQVKGTTFLFLAKHKGAALASRQMNFWGKEGELDPLKTYLFTDRSIYRPGQTVRFKGIHVLADTGKNDYRSLSGKKLTIRLRDVNGEEVEAVEVETNLRGSFSGAFTAPQGRLTGAMSIDEGIHGSVSISIEEYKRPRFQVTLNAAEVSPSLGEAVTLTGKAESYAGAAVDGAAVRWRVTREARWPTWLRWCGWFLPPTEEGAKEIAHGIANTAVDGSFEFSFTAAPDPGLAEKAEPSFAFTLHVDVTDTAGETRSTARTVTIGYTSLKAELSADESQTVTKPVLLKVSTTSLDGEARAASGTVTIHRLTAPEKVQRPGLQAGHPGHWPSPAGNKSGSDFSDSNQWPLAEVVQKEEFKTDETGQATFEVTLAVGEYRVLLASKDSKGRVVTALLPIRVLDPEAALFPVPVPHHLSAESWSLEPGQSLAAIWGTGYATGRALVEIEHRGKIVKRFWTDPGRTQQSIILPVTEDLRGGFILHLTQIRENRASLTSHPVSVPWSNKVYSLRWERMRDKLAPGAKETWTLVVAGASQEEPVEMVATMYDASLEAFLPHSWPGGFDAFYRDASRRTRQFHNGWTSYFQSASQWSPHLETGLPEWRRFLPLLANSSLRLDTFGMSPIAAGGMAMDAVMRAPSDRFAAIPAAAPAEAAPEGGAAAEKKSPGATSEVPSIDWSQVGSRKNLEETVFFFPHLLADENGIVRLEFTMPEALTTWNFLGFAHDRQLRAGLLTGETVTAKDLMVQPNPPRFLREGDRVEFTVKVTNKAASAVKGKVRLEFSDAATLADANPALGNQTPEQDFDLPAAESRTFSWKIAVPDGQGFLQYRAVASTGTVSDGEEGWLPVLSRRVLLTESITLPIRDAGEKTFTLPQLLESEKSDTLQHQSLTAQVVSQPAWFAVQSLPYLMEYPHESADQVFNRFYANALARHLATSQPKIRRVFDLWREAPASALESPLLKNETLKSVLIEETPWLREAKDETRAKEKLGLLFDQNRLESETAAALAQLEAMQIDNGAWPWFPGGRENEFITLSLVSGFGRLAHLGVAINDTLALRALDRLDDWMSKRHQTQVREKSTSFGSTEALALYARSFFLERRPVSPDHQIAVDYFRQLGVKSWPTLPRLSQAHLALGLKRFGDAATPATIVASLLERSVFDEELGRFWRDTEAHWWWYRAPIETQAMMIEAFREIGNDEKTADECRLWLLKQRQTQAWPSTKSTADAVYALLLGGDDLLGSDALVSLSLGETVVTPEQTEAGTGFYEKRFAASEIRSEMGRATLSKTDQGVAWGSLHWQYFEGIDKVKPQEGNPLTLKKNLFVKSPSKAGPTLKPLAAGEVLKPGDELVTRIELHSDRDLEYLHLKDQRGSGTEAVKILSGHRVQDGLAYYESTRDTASHFFIEYLPKGTYVFETSVRVQLRGCYESGIAEVQCLYAPEFNSHSGSVPLVVE